MSRKPQPITKRSKRCKRCGHDEWRFYGQGWRCVPCERKRWRDRFTPEQIRARNLRRKYGVTVEQFDAMLVAQQGRCDICAAELENPYVDHSHDTQQVRSLLCVHCNTILGMADDNPARLAAALDYLVRHHPERLDT